MTAEPVAAPSPIDDADDAGHAGHAEHTDHTDHTGHGDHADHGTHPEGVVEPWHALGSELIVDEPAVKCWLESVGPGESRPAHTHRHPWVTVVISGARGESRRPDGTLIAEGEAKAGDVRYNGADRLPFSHYLTNTSDQTLVMLAVELRDPAAAAPTGSGS